MKTSKYKILFLIGSLQAGGAERVVSILANQLTKKDLEVEILTWKEANIFYSFDERIIISSLPKLSNSRLLIKQMIYLRKYVKNNPVNLCLSFLAPFNMVTLLALIGTKQNVIVAERNDPRYIPFSYIMRIFRNWIYHLSQGILTQTDNNKVYFPKTLQKRIEVIYNPIFLHKELIGKALEVEKENAIVCVARLEKQKNLLMLIDAFTLFLETHPSYKLIIYGEGKQRKELEFKINSLNLQKEIELAGAKTNVYNLILPARMFVLSSAFEGMPNALIEAMCVGLPCISTRVSGAIDFIKSGYNGLLINQNQKQELVEAMSTIADNMRLARFLGKNATSLYDKLNVDIIFEQWWQYINKNIGRAK